MRLSGLALGVCLFFCAPHAGAAPPLESDGVRLGPANRAAQAPWITERRPEIDRPEPVHAAVSGLYRVVVILIQFPDNPADTLNHTPAAFEDLLFSEGTRPTGSLRDYYRDASGGQMDVDGIVTRWYTASHPYSYYTNGSSGLGGPPNARTLAYEAIALADPDVDFSQFDGNGPNGVPDGVVDGLFIVHAGPDAAETGSTGDIWSHKSDFGALQPLDGVSAFAYTVDPEEWAYTTAYTTAGDLISIGVFCHEFGHVLGLPDLYDLTDQSVGIGEWDLMGHGLYNHSGALPYGSTPAHFSAWSKITLGWVTPTWVSQDSAGVTIPPVETSGRVFRLWTNGEDHGQYFLIENRQPVGFDSALVRSSMEAGDGHAHGLLIYHVDDSVPTGNNDPKHKKVDVEEAGGPETTFGFYGVQNLDLQSGVSEPQLVCGESPIVRGNRGDRYDPWPGQGGAASFDQGSCPNSASNCVIIPSHVAVRNIQEFPSGDIAADFYVNSIDLQRLALAVDDTPGPGLPNNGNGLAEPGETVAIRVPLQNVLLGPTGPLTARLRPESYLALDPDSALYGSIPGGAVDSGTVVHALVLATPDPRGVNVSIGVHAAAGLVDSDSVQVLVGAKTGICDDFESTMRRWTSVALGCDETNEWHREAGTNHTPGGNWAWHLGPVGTLGSYAATEDARLISQPIRLSSASDTLLFWQRYSSEFAVDGLTVEISQDEAETWTDLVPVGGYSNGDRWTGLQNSYALAKVPLTGYTGTVQIGFRFRSTPGNGGGLGWWIDDVSVAGTDACAPTAVSVVSFDANPSPEGGVHLSWKLSEAIGSSVSIDRAWGAEPRVTLATLPWESREGSWIDSDVLSGITYRYWLTASRAGEASAIAGPVLAAVPASATPGEAPRVLAISAIQPNPFSRTAAFTVSLDRDGPFRVRIYRAGGSLVRTLTDAPGRAATIPFSWDGMDDHGRPAGSGVYFIELRSGGRVRMQRAVLLR